MRHITPEMAIDLILLPENLTIWAAVAAVMASFFTAALTAAFGLGGGLALLALMSAVFPAPAVIPVHGVAQAGSNAGRFYLQRKDVVWSIVVMFSAGGVIGAAIGGRLAVETPVWLLRGGVGLFILYSVWGPSIKKFAPGRITFFTTGVVASFLTMFFGATGPIAATMLSAAKLDRLNLVATHAACMVFQHTFKIIAFGVLGFAFAEWAFVIVAILLSGFAGTYAGTHFLRRMPERTFKRGFKYILTAIAIYLLIAAAINFKTG
ncbi:sulfite exporter TauE/SafE family protein [Hyphococcus flavus]|uniref:Probable membrane transporter protein n=1 Tax=Hyphococcus flavus TaxID=1866326 RepID=A0AAF0CGU6_9PROT|nr:sulfite exporter TauE/SafE family protein [Hyphococcus flavus]WDI32894.1 sulfite exporter TauE/SafE family protein [Hyphococcus flavus]